MLTKRQKQILDFIEVFIEKHDYAPSFEEIKKHLKLSSVSTVHFHISGLEKEGVIKRVKNEPRAIEIQEKKEELVNIPLAGTIAAGQPIEAIENQETIKIPRSQLSKSGEHFALRVAGNSMIDEGIFDSDIVVIKKQPTAENGETVVALINDNEITLKKLYREKNRFRLQPVNPTLKPIYTKNLIIQGKVVSVLRSFGELKEKIKEKEELTPETIKYMEETDIDHRKSLGQYFTPRSIREALLNKLPNTMNNPKILDPGCGTGEFLITARNYFKNPELHGWDIDENLVNVAQRNVSNTKFKKLDSLFDETYGQFDFVIGNPPYYEFATSEKIREKFGEIINGRANIFSLFIYQGLKWLKDGGYLAYVVPPSMNNGAYFAKLREFIVENSNIEYLHVLDDPKLFHRALQSTMLLILKKGKNKGDYLFRKNGILIFSENRQYLERVFKNKPTLHDLDYEVRTGRIIWNQNRHLLTNNSKMGVPLIWAHNIASEGLKLHPNKDKPQYVKINNYDIGPAIVVNRITGTVKSSKLRAVVIPKGMKFVAENHVNVVFPPSKQMKMISGIQPINTNIGLNDIANQLSSTENLEIVKNITGNTQISKTELEKLFPLSIKRTFS